MSAAAARRARKRANRRKGRLCCEGCGEEVPLTPPDDPYWIGIHDSARSICSVTWDGVAIVAWCRECGHEYASGGG